MADNYRRLENVNNNNVARARGVNNVVRARNVNNIERARDVNNVVRARDINNNDIVEESESDTESASETESELDPDRDIDAELHAAWERICVNMVRLGYRIDRSNARNALRASPNPKRLQHHRHGRRRPE